MRAGFFVREADGTVKSERSYLEFNFPDRVAGVLDRTPRAERPTPERMGGFHRSSQPPTAAPAMPAPRETERTPAPTYEGPEFPPVAAAHSKVAVGSVGPTSGCRCGRGGRALLPDRSDCRAIALNVDERDGQLRIEWNRNAKSVANATRGASRSWTGPRRKNIP
jgi:hypothetical protein